MNLEDTVCYFIVPCITPAFRAPVVPTAKKTPISETCRMTLFLAPMKSWACWFKYSVSLIVSEAGGQFGYHDFLPLSSPALSIQVSD